MPAATARRRLHPALAVLVAGALHAAALVASRWMSEPVPPPPIPFPIEADTEISLVDIDALANQPTPEIAPPAKAPAALASGEGLRARSLAAAREGRSVITSPAPHPAVASGNPKDITAGSQPSSSSSGSASRAIDLGLNDGVRRAALLGGWVDLPSQPKRPSDGGLSQGLAARDGERGLSRSSAARPAAYEAARRFAPATGIGVFDVRANARGMVLSVTLVNPSADAARWERVGQELLRLLQNRRLRVAPGSQGLAARWRIETGELARDNAERFVTKRAPALGEGPVHPREIRAESTQKSLEPGQLSPTLGVTLAGGGSGENIRVVLVDERSL